MATMTVISCLKPDVSSLEGFRGKLFDKNFNPYRIFSEIELEECLDQIHVEILRATTKGDGGTTYLRGGINEKDDLLYNPKQVTWDYYIDSPEDIPLPEAYTNYLDRLKLLIKPNRYLKAVNQATFFEDKESSFKIFIQPCFKKIGEKKWRSDYRSAS